MPILRSQGFDSTVDLFGEQSVQVLTTLLQAATVLAWATLIVLLSVRMAHAGILPVTARAAQQLAGALMPSRDAAPPGSGVRICLTSRAPPPSFHRNSPALLRAGSLQP